MNSGYYNKEVKTKIRVKPKIVMHRKMAIKRRPR